MLPSSIQPAPAAPARPGVKTRVMICDDSAVVRGLLSRLIESDPEFEIAATAANGEAAIRTLQRGPVDVIVLDVEMPVMDGLTALPKLLAVDRNVQIIVASTLTTRNAQVSLQALSAGAADYVPKPSSSSELNGSSDFRRELLEKIRVLGHRARKARGAPAGGPMARGPVPGTVFRAASPAGGAYALRKPSARKPQVLAIGSSTGGPQALTSLLAALPGTFDSPIVVAQHMPATFTAILAEHLTRAAHRPAAEAVDGEPLGKGRIYVAPGGHHLKVEMRAGAAVLRLTQDPPENFCRPAVDPLFRSVAQAFGSAALAVVLTGMGADGAKGARILADAGGTVIAQDEATSVVWGMPGATAQAGCCSAVLPLPEIAPLVSRLFAGGMP
jgi:two-component system, chemotaxis family, protein-glutamate methylesterase/glutaminase